MISQTSEYALRAVVWLAGQGGEPRTARQIAGPTRVPVGYLSKVMQALVSAGLATSQRGLGGGFQLARDPDKISILEVINAVDPIQRIERCPLELPEHSQRLCKLHRQIDDAIAAVESAFAECMVGELVESRGGPFGAGKAVPRAAAEGNLAAVRGRRPKARG